MLLSVLLIARELPPFLFGGPAGVVADKYDRRRVMLIRYQALLSVCWAYTELLSDLLRMVLVLCLLFVQTKETVPLLFIIVRILPPPASLAHLLLQSFLQFTVSAFFTPAKVILRLSHNLC